MTESTKMIVTFMGSSDIDLNSQGIGRAQAETLRNSFATFVEDWEGPEMSIYNNYDDATSNRSTG